MARLGRSSSTTIGSIDMPHLVESYDYMGIAHIADERSGEPARLSECVYRVAEEATGEASGQGIFEGGS